MRELPSSLVAKLQGAATTLCHVWKLIRADGVARGFTDHDRTLVLDGLTCSPRSALDPTETETALGLAAAGGEVAGALSDESLSEADLAAGRYDAATIETWLVDWSDASVHALLDVATLGEVRRTDRVFAAELRSVAHHLDQEAGRIYQSSCSADLGDARCGVGHGGFTYSAVSQAASRADRIVATLAAPAGLFADGTLTFINGAQAGLKRRVRAHSLAAGVATISLWTPLPDAPSAGDAFSIVAGCDKRFETCRDRFANAVAFRGFPHMPGNDYVVRYAANGDASLDGGLAR